MERSVKVKAGIALLEGTLTIPSKTSGIVLFAHGSGSSRLSPRNSFVAKNLQKAKLATLLIDLLTAEEDKIYETRFNIDFLTERLLSIVDWMKSQTETQELSIGLFGASTGAAAALKVAAELGMDIAAIVSRGGRPDLALDVIDKVASPTLLIVGGNDYGVIELNQKAYIALQCTKKLEIVKGATHLFEEPGRLEKVAELATDWFSKYLR